MRGEPAPRNDRKAAIRAEVRRRLQGTPSVDPAAAFAPPEILLIGPRGPSRDHLNALLRALGFAVHGMSEPLGAIALMRSRRFTAVFVDVESVDAQTLDLSQRLVPDERSRAVGALVLVAARLRAVDRVRAGLAGYDEVLVKPVAPGAVVRLLESKGIVLPLDRPRDDA